MQKELQEEDVNVKDEEQELTWDEATESPFVKIKTNIEKKLLIQNWELKVSRFKDKKGKDQKEFTCDVFNEDGKKVSKTWNTTALGLKKELRELLEKRSPTETIQLSILKEEEGNKTKWTIREVSK